MLRTRQTQIAMVWVWEVLDAWGASSVIANFQATGHGLETRYSCEFIPHLPLQTRSRGNAAGKYSLPHHNLFLSPPNEDILIFRLSAIWEAQEQLQGSFVAISSQQGHVVGQWFRSNRLPSPIQGMERKVVFPGQECFLLEANKVCQKWLEIHFWALSRGKSELGKGPLF